MKLNVLHGRAYLSIVRTRCRLKIFWMDFRSFSYRLWKQEHAILSDWLTHISVSFPLLLHFHILHNKNTKYPLLFTLLSKKEKGNATALNVLNINSSYFLQNTRSDHGFKLINAPPQLKSAFIRIRCISFIYTTTKN